MASADEVTITVVWDKQEWPGSTVALSDTDVELKKHLMCMLEIPSEDCPVMYLKVADRKGIY